MSKKHMKKIDKGLLLKITLAAILLVILIISAISISNYLTRDDPKARLSLNLQDQRISSGDETFLSISIQNTGQVSLIGTFNITVDDPSSVNLTIQQDRLEFNLLEGEIIQRRIPITAKTIAHRTDYEITVEAIVLNESISEESIILSVRR